MCTVDILRRPVFGGRFGLDQLLVRPLGKDVVYGVAEARVQSSIDIEPHSGAKEWYERIEGEINGELATAVGGVLRSGNVIVQLGQDNIPASGKVGAVPIWVQAEPTSRTDGDAKLCHLRMSCSLQLATLT